MGPADALSRKDKVETSDDNWEITILPGKNQYFHIHAIDVTLANKISSSSASDLIVIKALATMNDASGELWIPKPPRLIGNLSMDPYTSNTTSMFLNWLTLTW